MDRDDVLSKISEICKDVFEDQDLVVTESTTKKDIEGWDSLTQLSLIDELERTFDISFTLDEVNKSKSIGDLQDAVIRHAGI